MLVLRDQLFLLKIIRLKYRNVISFLGFHCNPLCKLSYLAIKYDME